MEIMGERKKKFNQENSEELKATLLLEGFLWV